MGLFKIFLNESESKDNLVEEVIEILHHDVWHHSNYGTTFETFIETLNTKLLQWKFNRQDLTLEEYFAEKHMVILVENFVNYIVREAKWKNDKYSPTLYGHDALTSDLIKEIAPLCLKLFKKKLFTKFIIEGLQDNIENFGEEVFTGFVVTDAYETCVQKMFGLVRKAVL